MILRDYHAENLMCLPERQGLAQVGLLDFQLAQMGQPGYDLVSLLQDARRDVSSAVEVDMIRHFANAKGLTVAEFAPAYAALGAQRALRIIGIFARLCLVEGKSGYLAEDPPCLGPVAAQSGAPRTGRLAQGLRHIAATADRGQPATDRGQMRRFPVMVFAAGLGTRMGALTRDRPKPLIEVAGRCLLDHALDLVTGAGLTRPVVNLHYRGDQIARHLAGRDATLSWERDEILDTGGGLRAALPLLAGSPVFTLNSDAVWTGRNALVELGGGVGRRTHGRALVAGAGGVGRRSSGDR